MIQAIIYDLDNTIFPVPAIGDELFKPVFGFSPQLTQACIDLQETLEYTKPIAPFEDYALTRALPGDRFLVTTGFDKMQRSKIRQLGIEDEFTEIHIVNPTLSSKKEVFAGILRRYGYNPQEVLAVGDDPESEIAAANALNMRTVLYDPQDTHNQDEATYRIRHYSELAAIVKGL